MESILENIEAIRKQKGIKQEVIAEAMGIKHPAYSNYINRESDITWSKLFGNWVKTTAQHPETKSVVQHFLTQ